MSVHVIHVQLLHSAQSVVQPPSQVSIGRQDDIHMTATSQLHSARGIRIYTKWEPGLLQAWAGQAPTFSKHRVAAGLC